MREELLALEAALDGARADVATLEGKLAHAERGEGGGGGVRVAEGGGPADRLVEELTRQMEGLLESSRWSCRRMLLCCCYAAATLLLHCCYTAAIPSRREEHTRTRTRAHAHACVHARTSTHTGTSTRPRTRVMECVCHSPFRAHAQELAQRDAALDAAHAATGTVALERQQLLRELAVLTEAIHQLTHPPAVDDGWGPDSEGRMGGGAADVWAREEAAARLIELQPYLTERLAQLKPYSVGSLADLSQFSAPLGEVPLVREVVQRREAVQRGWREPATRQIVQQPRQMGNHQQPSPSPKRSSASPGGAVSLAKRSLGVE